MDGVTVGWSPRAGAGGPAVGQPSGGDLGGGHDGYCDALASRALVQARTAAAAAGAGGRDAGELSRLDEGGKESICTTPTAQYKMYL